MESMAESAEARLASNNIGSAMGDSLTMAVSATSACTRMARPNVVSPARLGSDDIVLMERELAKESETTRS
jgi:hypothetical protein